MEFLITDFSAILLSLKLASTVTIILLIIATPLAYWLAKTESRFKAPISALISLPLVLPPTVIGFYLLLTMGPNGFVGGITQALGIGLLPFSFWGLVIASLFYSLPFVLQPIQNAIEGVGVRPIEVAATLGANAWDRFFTIILPLAKPGLITGAVLGFAHTVGEFGLVLMIGGNIPEETRVASIQIYDHVEALEYGQAHGLSLFMLIFSFLILFGLAWYQSKTKTSGLRYGL